MRLFLPLFLLISLFPSLLSGEVLQLKNGDRISGKIWRITRETILIETPYLTLSLPRVQVQKIQFQRARTPVRVIADSGASIEGWLLEAREDGLLLQLPSDSEEPVQMGMKYGQIREVIFFEEGYEFRGTNGSSGT